MTSHQLGYVRYLLHRIKALSIEKEAMSVLLDNAKDLSGMRVHYQWKESVERMRNDPVFCSAIEANLAPHFERMEQALQDEGLFKKLQECR
jgi:hypothetical protein